MQVPRLRIPVFVSAPSPDNLSKPQAQGAKMIHQLVMRYKLQWRALGRSDYPTKLPLREVLRMIRHCSGGIILGFEQFHAKEGVWKRGSPTRKKTDGPVSFPTPWNHLEAGMLYSARVPLLIFQEGKVRGGIFDVGVSEVFIHKMPKGDMSDRAKDDLDSVFQNWVALVRNHYYGE